MDPLSAGDIANQAFFRSLFPFFLFRDSWSEAEEITVKEEPKEEEPEQEVHEDRNIGKCPKCGIVVSSPIKKWAMDGCFVIGLFDCPTCKKPFREILNKKRVC